MARTKRARYVVQRLTPAKIVQKQVHRRLFRRFADKLGFVYFGYVDQHDDEHRLIRGVTVSPSHRDDHYCIGTYHGYDIAVCERTDIIHQPGLKSEYQTWLIVTADLHQSSDVPHIFIGAEGLSAGFYRLMQTKFPQLHRVYFGGVAPYDPRFVERFSFYAAPTHSIAAEKLFGGELNTMLVEHFVGFSFEVHESTLYVYALDRRPTAALLAQMLQCAAWLANEIDRH
ncbi:MAG TPA: hypothetical protein VFQ70_04265 [Candidatus Saccharimonadaceae bacterium]|nr:hypothetical protein [Candidatus Saccharimonadaceae bacterium]